MIIKRIISRLSLVFVAGMLTGCVVTSSSTDTISTDTIKLEEPVFVNYTCRTSKGRVIETTRIEIANDTAVEKSEVFLKRPEYNPSKIVAGRKVPDPLGEQLKPLIPAIKNQLALALVGQSKNQNIELTIEADVPEGMQPMNRFITKKRVAIVSKITKGSRQLFEQKYGRAPVIDETFKFKGKDSYRIAGFDETTITYEDIFEEEIFDTQWGPARSVIRGDKVITTIDAEEGTLIRAGGFIGQIVKVTDEKIIIDYGYPLGEKQLKCSVNAYSPNDMEK